MNENQRRLKLLKQNLEIELRSPKPEKRYVEDLKFSINELENKKSYEVIND